MSLLDPTTWSLDFFLLPSGKIPAGTNLNHIRRQRLAVGAVFFSVYALSRIWLYLVTKYVPGPYLDEFFHIPQAQKYCVGDFTWDLKITTPPGLYLFSIFLIRFLKWNTCSIVELREVNAVAICLVLFAALSCRHLIERQYSQGLIEKDGRAQSLSSYSIHTAVNIALFPPLFFFSSLYYTDVLSTLVVLAAYRNFLQGSHKTRDSIFRCLIGYAWGILALFMRQTNIFWVAVYTAGLEWVRACKKLSEGSDTRSLPVSFQDHLVAYSRGHLHEIPLQTASVLDYFWCLVSIGVSAISHPVLLIQHLLMPYIALLVSFAGFVLWNGGVVLGDKSNHVATLHLPQMLYIWPFIVFFSLPLIYPAAVSVLRHLQCGISHGRLSNASLYAAFRYLSWLTVGLTVSLIIVQFNTIIHPFTLADNRHYVFYVFRYTIRRHYLIKYLLVPIYLTCGLLVFACTGGFWGRQTLEAGPAAQSRKLKGDKSKAQITQKPLKTQSWTWLIPATENDVPETSATLIWLIATSLSLITAPLVEPRYFIIPWVIWRLQVPALGLPATRGTIEAKARNPKGSTSGWADSLKYWAYTGHDHRLWLETVWFLTINFVTAYIFLFRGFEWPSEPGMVQRFMW